MTKVLIADDHAIIRKGLARLLEESSETVLVDEAGDGEEALVKLKGSHYDLVFLDISMPGKDGFEVLVEIKSSKPDVPVVMFSVYPEEQYALRALRAGASGYLTKCCAMDELLVAMKKVLSGSKYISDSLADKMVLGLMNNSAKPLHETLSNREYQVLRMIAAGKSIREISAELSLNVQTVNTFRARLLRKMRMKSNSELIQYAINNNLLY